MTHSPANSNGIRAVIFDYGEVLCSAPPSSFIAAMAKIVGVCEDRFRQLYSGLRHSYDRGDLTPPEYWSTVAKQAGVTLTHGQIEQLREIDVAMWSNVKEDMLRWAADLQAAGIKTAVLSNMHLDMVRFARQNFAWLAQFDCLSLSSELRMAKPEPDIFHHCLQCLAVAPAEALFLDDRKANIEGGSAIGIQGIVVQSPEQLRNDLQAIGLAPLPSSQATNSHRFGDVGQRR